MFAAYRRAKIEYGPVVRAGDRFELFWPGYAVVDRQNRSPRKLLPVLASSLTADRRSLVLRTGTQLNRSVTRCCLSRRCGANRAWRRAAPTAGGRAELRSQRGRSPLGIGRWHIVVAVVAAASRRRRVEGLAGWHGWKASDWRNSCSQPGKLTLKTQLNLSHMLRPVVQPGSKLDAEFPPEDRHDRAELRVRRW